MMVIAVVVVITIVVDQRSASSQPASHHQEVEWNLRILEWKILGPGLTSLYLHYPSFHCQAYITITMLTASTYDGPSPLCVCQLALRLIRARRGNPHLTPRGRFLVFAVPCVSSSIACSSLRAQLPSQTSAGPPWPPRAGRFLDRSSACARLLASQARLVRVCCDIIEWDVHDGLAVRITRSSRHETGPC
jgi:hypothetical protein